MESINVEYNNTSRGGRNGRRGSELLCKIRDPPVDQINNCPQEKGCFETRTLVSNKTDELSVSLFHIFHS